MIYFIECNGRIKIGHSENPLKRFSKICSDAPYPCQLLGWIDGDREYEKAIQDKFADARAHGEWYHRVVELHSFIQTHVSIPATNRVKKKTGICGFQVDRGSLKTIALALGVTPQAISQWKQIPADKVIRLEAVTGYSREELRPDLFGVAA